MGKWLSSSEVNKKLKGMEYKEKLFRLFGLSLFCAEGFLSANFQPSTDWNECVKISETGEQYLQHVRNKGIVNDSAYEAFTLFKLFYHTDLLVNYIESDLSGILELLNQMERDGHLRWPYAYGNKLYHKYNDWPEATETDHLNPDEAEFLLDGMPQGVFQVGPFVSGPLGILIGKEDRLLSPDLDVVLWHCSDPGCLARHLVKLCKHKSEYQNYFERFNREIRDHFGPESEWEKPLLLIHRTGKWQHGRPYHDLPTIIGDCIIGPERQNLLKRALKSKYFEFLNKTLREKYGNDIPQLDLVNYLSPEAQHQALLLLPDRDLIYFIDELVANKVILIPPAELRTRITYVYGPDLKLKSSLSSLGIRSCIYPAVIELASTIWSTYESLGQNDDLSWRLRKTDLSGLKHSIFEFIRTHGPEKTVKDLILPSRSVITAIAEEYNFQIFPGEDERKTIRRLLWKLGFNLSRYEENYEILHNRLQEFQACLLTLGSKLGEGDKAKVRGVGVNLFVSMESFLEDLICYNVWMLSADHFTGTHFKYNRRDAHNSVVLALGAEVNSGEETFAWSIEGSNTLGTLMAYLHCFRAWLKNRHEVDKTQLERKKEDFPHYADDKVWVFPYLHTQLWADVPSEILVGYTETIESISKQLAQADLSNIRNGIDHKREDDKFPETDRMLACLSRIHQAVEIADTKRLIPKLFWGNEIEGDSHGNIRYTLEDYRGSVISLWDPPIVMTHKGQSLGEPCLVAPTDFLFQPNSTLRFRIVAKSEFSDYWENYPRRRFVPSEEIEPDQGIAPAYKTEETISCDQV
ncbi:MAG: hypothetical protein KQI81_00435 [Deltaproteobacteria bacterium]|nr:hypothetical protein [Deltaproteobacteria bacterium]